MAALAATLPLTAAFLGGWEILLILAVVLILSGAKKLPYIGRGLRFLWKEADDAASDAGKSLGGILGKPAAEALTPDNHVAELYQPGAFHHDRTRTHARKTISLQNLRRWWRAMRRFVLKLFVHR